MVLLDGGQPVAVPMENALHSDGLGGNRFAALAMCMPTTDR
jgi:hypothetical protein